MEIVWLGQPAAHEVGLAGGKAAALSRLARDHAVPPGFCVTTAAFDRWGPVPMAGAALLRDRIAAAYRTLGELCGNAAPPVAVRSSAVGEDGAGASFAGQYESYLNVTGAAEVVAAVARCWSSLGLARALEYGRVQGRATGPPKMAVLVQQLVPADVSAVVFSVNPVTRSRSELLINANWGLGESVVGGSATPDAYLVRKADLALLSRQIGDKQRMTVPASGGTREVAVPRLLREQAALDPDQIAAVARLAIALEAELGWPVDVECALQGGQLYLLQCRPVTVLD